MSGCTGPVVWRMWCALMLSVASIAAAPTTRQIHRTNQAAESQATVKAIPSLIAQQQTVARIKQIFAADYADESFNGRRALARRLIDASEQTQFDEEAKFVLLSEARRLCTQAGDVTTAFAAIDRLADAFPVSRLQLRSQVMQEAVPLMATSPAQLASVSICMDLADQCLVESDYDRADMLLTLALETSKRAKSKPYFDWVDSRNTQLRPLRDAWETARPAQAAMSRAPDDPAANLVVGKFTSFVKGDFDAGLLMLAKGADAELSRLAKEDLQTPADKATLQLKTAGQWWDLSDTQPADYHMAIRRRAGYWYARAVNGLDGLDRALAQRRLLELNPPTNKSIKPARPPDALKLTAHWYRANIAEVNWETAQRICRESGGDLVSAETRAEGELLIKLAKGRVVWLGGSTDPNGRWGWLSGAEFFYTNWAGGEPATVAGNSHLVIGTDGAWRTQTGRAGFICEWSD
ncbi:MAG TPA: C-type lectin domain-containing protein [Tepidisphaeraceae bacterium]|nr:C-type lectin domain-containing protein [Tepidisphaeraceae bacterium]